MSAPASAHVYLQTNEAGAGETVDLAFVIPHGCGSAATSALYVRLPAGVTASDAVPAPGFTEAVGAEEVAFTGGDLPDGGVATFTVTVSLPDVHGRLHFPSVQECGAESVNWLDIPGDGRADGQPAPSLFISGGSQPTGEADVTADLADEGRGSPVWPAVAAVLGMAGLGLAGIIHRRRQTDWTAADQELAREAEHHAGGDNSTG